MTGGGSGGHITPLLSLAHALRNKTACRLIYIGLSGDKIDKLKDRYNVFDETYYIKAGKFRRYHGETTARRLLDIKTWWLNFRDFFRFLAGTLSAWRLMSRIKPDVLFVKGGFVGVPAGIAAKLHGVPIVTHDSDAVAGLANRLVGRWAVVHATGMPAKFYRYPKDSIRYVGIPVDERITPVNTSLQQEYKGRLGLSPDSTVLLIAGGGLGAQSINKLILETAEQLLKSNPSLHILHITGAQNEASVNNAYLKLPPELSGRVTAVGFSSDFYQYSGAADLIVTRAGATALAEFATQQKACLVIPSPHLAGGHQLKNAEQLKTTGAAVVLPNNAAPSEFSKAVNKLLTAPQIRVELAGKLAQTARPGAADNLAEIILDVGGRI